MFLGMVRQWQELFFNRRYSATYLGVPKDKKPSFSMYDEMKKTMVPDFKKLAEAYNVRGYIIDKKSDVRPVLEEALKLKEPVVMDFRIDIEENVFPMVPAGAPLNRMLEHTLA